MSGDQSGGSGSCVRTADTRRVEPDLPRQSLLSAVSVGVVASGLGCSSTGSVFAAGVDDSPTGPVVDWADPGTVVENSGVRSDPAVRSDGVPVDCQDAAVGDDATITLVHHDDISEKDDPERTSKGLIEMDDNAMGRRETPVRGER